MAQKIAFAAVSGRVLKVERIAGTFTGSDGSPVAYDYHEARVLDENADVTDVRFPTGGALPLPARGEDVSLRCEIRASGGNVKVTAVEFVGA